ncbi:MAG TPA: iron-containing alcohol dehydrogenase, partial [Bacillota bacterium]
MDLRTSFRYRGSALRIHAGAEAVGQLRGELERLGVRRALIVCGPSVARCTDLPARLAQALGGIDLALFDGVRAGSPLPAVEAGVAAARQSRPEALIAVGGGSAVVTARAIAILLAEGRPIQELCTQYPPDGPPVSPHLRRPKLPIFNVLTTPTTAADRAGAAVLDPAARRRLELYDPKTRPVAVILDGAALLTAPLELVRDAAANALCGVIEGLVDAELNAFALADLRQAFELLWTWLPRLHVEPHSADVRLQLATAALLCNRAADAGAALAGLVASLAHALQAGDERLHQGRLKAALLGPV